jgi:hypothetical protein
MKRNRMLVIKCELQISAAVPCPNCHQATHFLAPGWSLWGGGEREIGEEIEVLRIPVDKISDFLLNLPGIPSWTLESQAYCGFWKGEVSFRASPPFYEH